MKNQKHTPVPWDVCVSDNSNFVHIETRHDNPAGAGEQIATVNKGNKTQRITNALLIVSAVNSHDNLVANLKQLLACMYALDPENPAVAMAEAAIIKAGWE